MHVLGAFLCVKHAPHHSATRLTRSSKIRRAFPDYRLFLSFPFRRIVLLGPSNLVSISLVSADGDRYDFRSRSKRRRSQVVRQRSAKPPSPVRIRAAPLIVRLRQTASQCVTITVFRRIDQHVSRNIFRRSCVTMRQSESRSVIRALLNIVGISLPPPCRDTRVRRKCPSLE